MSGTRPTMIIRDDPNAGEPVHFVWFRHNGQLLPQKWYGDQVTGTDKLKNGTGVGPGHSLGFFRTLGEEERNFPIEVLAKLYPNPEEKGG